MKLFNAILYQDLAKNGLICVDVNLNSSEINNAEYTFVKVQKNSVEIIESGQANINDLSKVIQSLKRPIILSIGGKGILYKKYNDLDELEKITRIYTNRNLEKFYIQQYVIPQWGDYVVFADKQVVDNIVERITTKEASILDLQYSPLNLITQEQNESTSKIGRYLLDYQQKTITVNCEETDNAAVSSSSPFANSSFSLSNNYLQDLKTKTNKINEIFFNNHFVFNLIVKKLSLGTLLIFSLVLLVNFLLYQNQFDKNNTLKGLILEKGITTENSDTLEKKILDNEKFLKNNLPHNTLFAFYVDKICATIPNGIKLNFINLFPISKENTDVDNNETIEVTKNQLIFKGHATNSIIFDSWLKQLNSIPWIEKSIIVDFTYIDLEKNARFELDIRIRE
jgi:hypothetical protein